MSTRLAVYELAARHAVPAAGIPVLLEAAGVGAPPRAVSTWLWRGAAVAAAALMGLGLVLWVAANWATFGRMGRFALLEGAVVVACLGAAARSGLRPAAGLAGLMAIGGLFAYFGQTYQTGADAWQLFTLWAVLALPLSLGVRSDVAWAPWALVAMTAAALWTYAHTAHQWRVHDANLGTFALAWGVMALLVAALSPALRRWTGAGIWAFRIAATLAIVQVMLAGLVALFDKPVPPHYVLALCALAAAGAAAAHVRWFDVFVVSAAALAVDTVLVAGLGRLLLDGASRDPFGRLLLMGLIAAALLAGSVHLVLRLARRANVAGASA